ncbi:hypothetical protein GKC56_01945 [Neisseriaceae bacterium PsAf]|nr:hypothetical protein [Neisseriaceae bacterium PsAf]
MNDFNQVEDKSSEPELNSKPKKQKTGRGVAFFALFLSIISLLGVVGLATNGYTYIQNKLGLAPQQAAEQKLSVTDEEKLSAENINGQNQQQLQAVQDSYEQLTQFVQNQQQAILNLDNSYNELFKSRYQWLLNETEYGLGIVILQLINTGNVEAAVRSLNYIQERLQSFDYAELLPLKKSIAQDIDNLKSAQVIDMSDTLVKLDVLTSKVDSLPLVIESVLKKTTSTEEIKRSVNEPSYVKIWDDFIATIKSGVQVKHLNSSDPMLISPEQTFFIKENLKLELLNVRLALLQRQQDSYTQYLDAIRNTIKEYFDLESVEVQNFITSIDELASLNIVAPNIDLMKDSLSIVKSLQSNQMVIPLEKKVIPETDSSTLPQSSSESDANEKLEQASTVQNQSQDSENETKTAEPEIKQDQNTDSTSSDSVDSDKNTTGDNVSPEPEKTTE